MVNIISARLSGRKDFHVRYIKLSYRIRGRVARAQINIVASAVVLIMIDKLFNMLMFPEKISVVRRHIIKMLEYSAINRSANMPLLYSVLNPDTSSDSPSARSNGVRLVSARLVIYHITKTGMIKIDTHEYMCEVIEWKSIINNKIKALIKIRVIDTS